MIKRVLSEQFNSITLLRTRSNSVCRRDSCIRVQICSRILLPIYFLFFIFSVNFNFNLICVQILLVLLITSPTFKHDGYPATWIYLRGSAGFGNFFFGVCGHVIGPLRKVVLLERVSRRIGGPDAWRESGGWLCG